MINSLHSAACDCRRTYDLTFSVGSEFVVLVFNDSTEVASLSATVNRPGNMNNTLSFNANVESYVDRFPSSPTCVFRL